MNNKIEQSSNEILKRIKQKAELGNAEAQLLLGLCHDEGDSVKHNYKKAVCWWRKAANQGVILSEVTYQNYIFISLRNRKCNFPLYQQSLLFYSLVRV